MRLTVPIPRRVFLRNLDFHPGAARISVPRAIGVQSRAMANRKAKKSRTSIKRKSSRSYKPAKLPKDAVALVVAMHAKPGQELLLQAALTALVRPTRNEEGCLLYDLHRSTDVPGDFLFYEIWSSREAHAAHKQTPHFLRWNARKDTLLASRESTFWKKIALEALRRG
jgi:quinol monooxygenase YgiN